MIAQLSAQKASQRDLTAPLSDLEKELAPMARQILKHPSKAVKDSLNRLFVQRMMTILKREDSYNYPFDSLKTVSRLFPEDQSFRIFTWGLTDFDREGTYRNTFYYGIVQRIYDVPGSPKKIVVIPLTDRLVKSNDIETLVLTHQDWLGALYYHPKNTPYGVLTFEGKVARVSSLRGKKKMVPVKYYVLLGLSEHDINYNYKVVDVLAFDPVDSNRVLFGAPIFYYGGYPRVRRVFRYSDNSPFSLNWREVITSSSAGVWKKKEKMIVYDHIDRTKKTNNNTSESQKVLTDGTQDAMFYHKKRFRDQRKGYFLTARNVRVYIPETDKYDPEVVRKQARRAKRQLRRELN